MCRCHCSQEAVSAKVLYNDQQAVERSFSEKDAVYLCNTTGGGNKWVPGVIVKQTGPVSYKVQGRDADVTFRRHGDQLRPRFIGDELVKETDCSEMDTSFQPSEPEEEKQAVSEFSQRDCGGVTGVTQSPRRSFRISETT